MLNPDFFVKGSAANYAGKVRSILNKTIFTEKVLEAEITLYRVAKSILLNNTDCEDAVQDAILKAYKKLDTLKEERFFKTWLVRILINECYRLKRSRRPVIPFEEYFAGSPSPETGDYTDLHHAVASLPQKIRITVVLYYVEGYPVEDIGAMLRIPSGTVKSRLAKGRKLLKEQLTQMEVIYG